MLTTLYIDFPYCMFNHGDLDGLQLVLQIISIVQYPSCCADCGMAWKGFTKIYTVISFRVHDVVIDS